VLWLSVGETVTAWLRDFSRERARSALAERVLLVYCLGLFVSQMLPLDLTISLPELARKYRNGQILLQPFAYRYASSVDMIWDYFGDIMINVPLGAAAVVLWARERRRPAVALAIGITAVALIELCQVFVNSRIADVTDILTGSVGVLLGVGVATALSQPSSAVTPRRTVRGLATLARVGLVAWTVMLLTYHWSPFNFSFKPDRVTTGVRELLTVPLFSYYQGSEFHAFTEMTRKSLLALPLGVLLHFSWPDRGRTSRAKLRLVILAAIGFCLLLAIEIGQVFLPTRIPDITDVIFGDLGVVAGVWITGLLVAPSRDRALTERITPGASLRS
jgi:glycopeptide antibiotics resistance protein